jgi:hypothetical protein
MNKHMKKMVIIGSLALGATLITASCGLNKSLEPFKDAPRSSVDNGQPADLVRFPDGFSNGATKCDHGNRVYVVFHGDAPYGSIAVVPNAQLSPNDPCKSS